MMTQTKALKPAAERTCSTCLHFNNYNLPDQHGWCLLFDLPARTFHIQTNDCVLNSQTATAEPDNIFANYSQTELEALRESAFPTKIVWMDDEGYPMGDDDPVANAYFDPNFVTLPNEPF